MAYVNENLNNSELYFQTKIYTGTGSTLALTLDGTENMQPDFVWIKSRSDSLSHALFDVIRGVTKVLNSNATTAEYTNTDTLTAFGTDGFTIGKTTGVNTSGQTRVAWCWKAGGTASSNSDGSITTSVSANSTSGMSILAYTGTGSGSATIGHGLGVKPKILLTKPRNITDPWILWFDPNNSGTSIGRLTLNSTDAQSTSSNSMINFNTTTITLPSLSNDAWSGTNNYIGYAFAEKKGYFSSGTYEGNGNENGPYIHLGFSPALVVCKEIDDTGYYAVSDNKRDGYNLTKNLYWNDSMSESTANQIDHCANGFKIRSSAGSHNQSGSTHIYMAWAQSPFVNSNGVPTNAR